VKYTVIGVYPDELAHMGADEASYVEWVQATTADAAVEVAKAVDHDRRNSLVVAVIPGHHVDQLFDKGLASAPQERNQYDGQAHTRAVGGRSVRFHRA